MTDIGLAFLCHPYHRGGVTRWMVNAAVEHARRGSPTWFVCPEPQTEFISAGGRPTVLSLLRGMSGSPWLTISAPPVGWMYELGTSTFRARTLADAVSQFVPPDVPIIVSDDAAAWSAAARCATRNPMIGVLHADDPTYYALADAYRSSVAALVGVSQRVTTHVSIRTTFNEVQIATIPCGIPLGPSDTQLERAMSDVIRMIWVGRIEEHQKRVSDLVLIAEALRRRGAAFSLTIVGDGPERGVMERRVAAAGLHDAIAFLGWQTPEHVCSLLQSSDIFLLPSNFEGTPIAAMEALAAGCAVVASRVSGLEDYETLSIADGALSLFPVGNIEAAAAHVLTASQMIRAERIRRSRHLAKAEFSIERSVDRYETLADSITARRTGRISAALAPQWVERTTGCIIATARYTRHQLLRTRSAIRRHNDRG